MHRLLTLLQALIHSFQNKSWSNVYTTEEVRESQTPPLYSQTSGNSLTHIRVATLQRERCDWVESCQRPGLTLSV
ncbi:UNVERIFIED_CONTAM: hypothetical protein FKN15_009150 [Acipenser sinensis]